MTLVEAIRTLKGKAGSLERNRTAAISSNDMPPTTTKSSTFFSVLFSSISIFGTNRASSSLRKVTLLVVAEKSPRTLWIPVDDWIESVDALLLKRN